MAASSAAMWKDPAQRTHLCAAMSRGQNKPETLAFRRERAKVQFGTTEEKRARTKAMWADPVKRADLVAKLTVSQNRPETRASRSASIARALAENPELIAKRNEGSRKARQDPEKAAEWARKYTETFDADPENARRRSTRMARMRNAPGWHERMVAGQRASWTNPTKRAVRLTAMSEVALRPDVKAKHRVTMRANNSYRQSRDEDRFASHVLATFPKAQRSATLDGLEIDIFVPETNTYIQFDGAYWHGLDRPLDVIAASPLPRDACIHKTFLRDRQQDTYCREHGLRLVRITDREFAALERENGVQEWISATLVPIAGQEARSA